MIGLDYSWIKLPRTFCDWRWYKDSHMVLLYLHILLHASFSDKEIGEVVIKRGQMLTSYAQLCNNTGLSLQTVRTCIKKLLKTKQIKVLSCKHHTTISVVAYDSFQPEGKDELNPNWVKLYRKIEDWRWYKDAITFHLFIHLLLNVNYCPSANGENILGRGQIMVTRRSLTESTNISDRSIRTCIEKLQKSKEILISQKATNRPHIITICNYDSYQAGFAPSNIQLTYNQHTTNIQCESVQQALVFASKSDQPNLDVNTCGVMGYIDNDSQTNTQLTYNQHTANMQPTHDQQTDNIQVTTYKNIRNKEIKKNISSTSARAREVENFEVLDGKEEKENQQKKARKESFLELLEQDELWLGAIARKFSLARVELVKRRLEDFDLDMICRGKTTHTDIQDYKSHFVDWLYKNNSATSKSNNQYGVSKQDKQNGSRFVPKSSEGAVYTQSF